MTATQTQLRRGTESQCDAGTPVEGEVWVDTTNDRLRLGDGLTTGGIEIPNAFDLQDGSFTSAVSSTGTNDIVLTFDPPIASYVTGMEVNFFAPATNSGAVTIDAGDGPIAFEKISGGAITAMVSGDIVSGAPYTARFNGTKFIQVGGAGGVSQVTGTDGISVSPTSGSPIVRINTNNAVGVGAYAIVLPTSYISNGATFSGGYFIGFRWATNAANFGYPVLTNIGSISGTWRNVSGGTLGDSAASGIAGLCIRIA